MSILEQITSDPNITILVEKADKVLAASRFTMHDKSHTLCVSHYTGMILSELGFDPHVVELGKIAGYLHDIGNVVNRMDHSHSGANLAFDILSKYNIPQSDIWDIVSAIGNHDIDTGWPVNDIGAALIIADKCDVRRSRVRDAERKDLHDAVNGAVSKYEIKVAARQCYEKIIEAYFNINTQRIADFFKLYYSNMRLCVNAAKFLNCRFKIYMNDNIVMDSISYD